MKNCSLEPVRNTTTTLQDYMRFIERWEGRRPTVYNCTSGFPTIGVGHRIKSGESFSGQTLNNRQITMILRKDALEAYIAAKMSVESFETLPHEVKLILCDMSFNLGKTGLQGFKKAIAACNRRDWKTMAAELENSKWFFQVGNRSKNHVETLKKIGA